MKHVRPEEFFVLKIDTDKVGHEVALRLAINGFFPDTIYVSGILTPDLQYGLKRYLGLSGIDQFLLDMST